MQFLPMRSLYTMLIAPVLLVAAGMSGCEQMKQPNAVPVVTFTCHPEEGINVDLQHGVDRQAIYLCEGKRVVWKRPAGVNTFLIVFAVSPFEHGETTFDEKTTVWPKMKHLDNLTVFKYEIMVNNTAKFDPHVIGGGGY